MCISSIAKGVGSWVRKNPIGTVGIVAGAGLIAYAAATKSKKQNVDAINHMALTNPMLNPLGWMTHIFNPASKEAGVLDSPFAKYVVDRNNKSYQEYYNNLSPSEKVAEFYKNGGRGVTFETQV